MNDTSTKPEKNETTLETWRNDLCFSLVFLTRIPLKFSHDLSTVPFNRAMRAFPLVGFLLGVGAVVIGLILQSFGFSDLMISIAMVMVLVLLTGALHEDGLADVVDGFGATSDKIKKIEIMRDSRIGAYGTLALIFCIFLKVAALTSFEDFDAAFMALIATSALSRFGPMLMVDLLDPASKEGLSSEIEKPEKRFMWQGFGLAVALFMLFVPFHAGLLTLVFVAIALYLFAKFCGQQIGGHTGDTCGASQQVVEIISLCSLAALL